MKGMRAAALFTFVLVLLACPTQGVAKSKWRADGHVQVHTPNVYWTEEADPGMRLMSRPLSGGSPVVVHQNRGFSLDFALGDGVVFVGGGDSYPLYRLVNGRAPELISDPSNDGRGDRPCDEVSFSIWGGLLIRTELLFHSCGDLAAGGSQVVGLPWGLDGSFTPLWSETYDTLLPDSELEFVYSNGHLAVLDQEWEFPGLGIVVQSTKGYWLSQLAASTSGSVVVSEVDDSERKALIRLTDGTTTTEIFRGKGKREATFCGDRLIQLIYGVPRQKRPRRSPGAPLVQYGPMRAVITRLEERDLNGALLRVLWRRPTGKAPDEFACDGHHAAIGFDGSPPAIISLG